MKLEEYKAGEYKQGNGYKAFLPSNINYNWGWDDTKLDSLLAEANRQIGELNAYSLLLPNVELYIKMHVKIEANKSSRIEGTKTTIEEDLSDCLKDLELFINNEDIDTPDLIKIAMIHYQFESIHPFLDGNGRIGRLLIPLYLQSKKYLDNPCLYISYFFEKNRDLYYQKLNDVRVKNDIIGWIKFFLEGIIETAEIAKKKFKKVVELTKKVESQLTNLGVKYDNAKKIVDYFYNEPRSSRKKISEALKMPESTVNGVISELKLANIIQETTGFSRNQVFVFSEYVSIFLSE